MPSAVPNYLSTDADGSANATFAGGINIAAVEVSTPPPQRQVRWIAQSDGSVVGYIFSADVRLIDFQYQTSIGAGPIGNSMLSLFAGILGAKGALNLFLSGAGGPVSVAIADSEGASSFVRAVPGTAFNGGWAPVASPGIPLPGGVARVGLARQLIQLAPAAAGAGAYAVNSYGGGNYGHCVMETSPAAHWNFICHPRTNDIVIQNNGAAQNIDLRLLTMYLPID